jgi:uncharacterized protein involved in exopolysaccharide biosynthesis
VNARLPADSIQQQLDAFKRHSGKALAFFLLIVVTTIVALLITPGAYESDALLFVKLGRESVTLDAIATTGQTVNISESREFEINTVAEVLANDGLAAKVADKMGPDRLLRNDQELETLYGTQGLKGTAKLWVAKLLNRLKRSGAGTDLEHAVKVVAGGRSVHPTPRTGLVQLSSTANTPELSREILTTMIDEYLSQHGAMHRSSGGDEFFAEQTRVLKDRLTAAESELMERKNNAGMLSIAGSRGQLQQQMDLIEQQRRTVQAQLAAADSQAAALSEFVASLPDRMTTSETSGLPNAARDSMRQQLYQQEIELQDLLSRLTESHPQIVSAKKKIADVRKILESQPDDRSQKVSNVNTTHQSLSLETMRQQSVRAGLESQLASLNEQREEVLAQISQMNETEKQVTELERQVALLAGTYNTYADKLEQTRIASELEKGRISNVHVIQQPSISTRPASPNKPLILAGALMLGAIGAYLIVALCEIFDRRVYRPEEIEELIDIPVLATLPRVTKRYVSLN